MHLTNNNIQNESSTYVYQNSNHINNYSNIFDYYTDCLNYKSNAIRHKRHKENKYHGDDRQQFIDKQIDEIFGYNTTNYDEIGQHKNNINRNETNINNNANKNLHSLDTFLYRNTTKNSHFPQYSSDTYDISNMTSLNNHSISRHNDEPIGHHHKHHRRNHEHHEDFNSHEHHQGLKDKTISTTTTQPIQLNNEEFETNNSSDLGTKMGLIATTKLKPTL